MCMLDDGTPSNMKQMLIDVRGDISSKTTIIGNFNTPVSSMTDQTKHEHSSNTANLATDQMNITNIYRTLHSRVSEHTFYRSVWNTSLGNTTCKSIHQISTHLKLEIISCNFSDYNR